MSLTPKKLILAGFAIVLLIGIPLMFFLLKQQKNTANPTASTTLSLTASTTTVNVGDTFNLDLNVDPGGVNQVSFLKLVLNYDTTKLATLDAGFSVNPWTLADGTQFTPSILQGPTYDAGTITVTISTGQDPKDAIQKLTKIATFSFQAIGATETTPTQVSFATSTQVLSIGATNQYSQNILANTNPASITINQAQPTPTPTPVITPTPTLTPSATTASPTPTIAISPNAPTCTSLTLDQTNQGTAPYTLAFTVAGSSSTSTISKATFDFGDGQTQDVTQNGGIGSNTVSIVLAHTYTVPGTYPASATLTDASGNVSSVTNCSQTITITQGTSTANTASPSGTLIAQVSPSPLPPSGPNNSIIMIGVIGIILAIIGASLLFAL